MSTTIGGARGASLDSLVMAVQRENAETEKGLLAEAGSRFEARKSLVEAERKKVTDEESDVLAQEGEVEAHVAQGPNPLDAFFLKGAVHESLTKAKKAEVSAEQADVAAAETDLRSARHELAKSLDEMKTTLDTMTSHRSDTESMLDASTDVASLILGRIKA